MVAVDICNTICDVNGLLDEKFGHRKKGVYIHPSIPVDFFEKNPLFFADAKPYQWAVKYLQKLVLREPIVYLTARPVQSKEVTEIYLKENCFPDGKTYFTQDKARIAKSLGVRWAFEDAPHEIQKYQESGIPVLVFSQDYNVQFPNRFLWEELCEKDCI